MPVAGIPRDRLVRVIETPESLRPGQIVQGKILTIYPNHRAELQIGSQKMIAQLEAPLIVGERYHFQVANTSEVVELKVIGTNLKSASVENMTQLLNELNLKSSRTAQQFVHTLLDEKLPFTKQQLQQALSLLERTDGSKQAQRVLMEMIARNLPLNESVFNALLAKSGATVSEQLTQLLDEVQNSRMSSDIHMKLESQLLQLLQKGSSEKNQLLNLFRSAIPHKNLESSITHLLQNQGAIQQGAQTVLSEWQSEATRLSDYQIARIRVSLNQMPLPPEVKQALLTMLQNDQPSLFNTLRTLATSTGIDNLNMAFNNQSMKQQFLNHIQQFTQSSGLAYENLIKGNLVDEAEQMVQKMIAQVSAQKGAIQHVASSLTREWSPVFSAVSGSPVQLDEETMRLFKKDVGERLLPLLQQEQRQAILNLLQNNQSLERVFQFIQTLNSEETYQKVDNLIQQLAQGKMNLTKEMLNQYSEIRALLQSLHLSADIIRNSDTSQHLQQTMKGLLLQLTQQNDSLGERAHQVLHFMNGLQLQSVHETSHFIQASLQVPGEKIGLNDDLFMEFESKKTDDGKIDPDFCRILFFLNLHQLKDTVVDMHVQKRLVTLTIYNEHAAIEKLARPFKNRLNDGLESIDYRLTAIRFKPLHQQTKINGKANVNHLYKPEEQRKGVDFRI